MIIPVFIYWFYLQIKGKTIFPRRYTFTNVIFIYIIMELIIKFIPNSAFRLGLKCGSMNESMFIWFLIIFKYIRTK